MNSWAKALALLAILVGLVVGGLVVAVMRWQEAPLPVDGRMVVTLERGEAFRQFAGRMASRGLLTHPSIWTWLARLSGDARRVQAGEYEVVAGDTPQTLLAKLVAGKVVSYDVKIVEGWTAMQAVAVLAAHPALAHEISDQSEQTLLDALGLPGGHAEGMFFPETYHFVRGDSDADVLRRAYARMEAVLGGAWESRDAGLPYDTAYEALIAASLIEKETGQEADRPIISQVFALRLQRGMRLQTDPSVIYGLGQAFDGNLRRTDLRAAGPYNTYLNRGLPPTPIALPGARSIEAALHPAAGDFLYFVSRGDGSSQFSRSLDEHEEAVRRYQLN